MTRVERVDGRNDLWELAVIPQTSNAIEMLIGRSDSCETEGAVCTADGRALSQTVHTQIGGPDALSAHVAFLPIEGHDGVNPFRIRIKFSARVSTGYETMRDRVLRVTNGEVQRAYRVRHQSDDWRFTISPTSYRAVQIVLPATTDCADEAAICTDDGRMLSQGLETEVWGPRTVSVADARAIEGQDATMDFEVRISRPASEPITVDWATSDGTATAGSDYVASSGTLTFGSGDRVKTVAVPILDDDHDEDEETFTLTLSNPGGGSSHLIDATATGRSRTAIRCRGRGSRGSGARWPSR